MAGAKISEIVGMMAGRQVDELFPRSERTPGDAVIDLEGLDGVEKPIGATLTLRRGEVLGIAGLVGAGRTELLRAIFGLDPVKSGTIKVTAISGAGDALRALRAGGGLGERGSQGRGARHRAVHRRQSHSVQARGARPSGTRSAEPAERRVAEVDREALDQDQRARSVGA